MSKWRQQQRSEYFPPKYQGVGATRIRDFKSGEVHPRALTAGQKEYVQAEILVRARSAGLSGQTQNVLDVLIRDAIIRNSSLEGTWFSDEIAGELGVSPRRVSEAKTSIQEAGIAIFFIEHVGQKKVSVNFRTPTFRFLPPPLLDEAFRTGATSAPAADKYISDHKPLWSLPQTTKDDRKDKAEKHQAKLARHHHPAFKLLDSWQEDPLVGSFWRLVSEAEGKSRFAHQPKHPIAVDLSQAGEEPYVFETEVDAIAFFDQPGSFCDWPVRDESPRAQFDRAAAGNVMDLLGPELSACRTITGQTEGQWDPADEISLLDAFWMHWQNAKGIAAKPKEALRPLFELLQDEALSWVSLERIDEWIGAADPSTQEELRAARQRKVALKEQFASLSSAELESMLDSLDSAIFSYWDLGRDPEKTWELKARFATIVAVLTSRRSLAKAA